MSSPLELSHQASSTYTILLSAVAVLVCHILVSVYKSQRSLNFLPGRTYFLSPALPISTFFLPPIRGFSAGKGHLLAKKYTEFEKQGCSVYRVTSIFPKIKSVLVLADPDTIKACSFEVASSRARFPKPIEVYAVLAFFGRNIVVSEGDEWKKYRKISAPAFSEKNNKLVWDETITIMEDLFADVWGDKESITIDHCLDITVPLALFVIGAAGFGKHMSWKGTGDRPAGHDLSFKEALHRVAGSDIFIKLALPDWAMKLTKRTRQAQKSFDELETYMSEMIQERLHGEKVERNDLFSNLLESNSTDGGPNALTEHELAGNIFIFLIAGHETTAHTLCFALALLALYPAEQEKLFHHIKSAFLAGGPPTYEDRIKLNQQCLAVIYETMRIVPPVTNIPKVAAEDTTITATNSTGEKVVIPVPKGTVIGINAAGLHYNPHYWDDPHAFKPDRFLGDYNRDAFVPFSTGPRSCIGRRFSETEGVAALAMLVSRYRITVKEEPQFAHETFDERKARVLSSRPGITVTPIRVPLVFTRRHY